MFSLLLLLAAPQAADDCQLPPYDAEHPDRPAQPSGDGLWIGGIAFEQSDIVSAKPATDAYIGQPVLQLKFSETGRRKLMTAQRCGIGNAIELSIDRKLISRPILNERITGAQLQISGGWDSMAAVSAIAHHLKPD